MRESRGRSRVRRWTLRLLVFVLAVVLLPLGACRVAAARRERLSRTEAAPASGRFVRAGDVLVFVQEGGPASGPVVVFLHGTGSWGEMWRETLDATGAAGFRTVAVDLPPFGYSERPKGAAYRTQDQALRILGVLDAVGARQAVLVGHSFGGRATLLATLSAQDRVKSLVLVDPALGLHQPETRASGLVPALLAVRPVRNALMSVTATNPMFTRRFLSMMIADPAAANDARIAMLQRPLVLEGSTDAMGEWARVFLTGSDASLREAFAASPPRMPVLLVWGSADAVTPLPQGQWLNARIPGSRLVVLDGLGHIPQIESPPRFNAALLAFLAEQR
jgi:pimeloyl-ACP methyl ester carboxylesterase